MVQEDVPQIFLFWGVVMNESRVEKGNNSMLERTTNLPRVSKQTLIMVLL